VGIGEITVVWIGIDIWVTDKMALEEGEGRGDGMRSKRGVRAVG
jgi:hypothetical protein